VVDELQGHLLLGRVEDEDVGEGDGVEHVQGAEDVLVQVPHLTRHRQERKDGVLEGEKT
jgi:hypothetical protein